MLLWAPIIDVPARTAAKNLDNERKLIVRSNLGPGGPYCEDGLSLFLLNEIFAAGSLVSALACCLLEIAMVAEIRRGMTGWQTAEWQRDIAVTFRSHRRFYPASPLRAAFVVSAISLGLCIASLIMIYRVARGL
jgi:hypothetical protein